MKNTYVRKKKHVKAREPEAPALAKNLGVLDQINNKKV